MDKIIASSLEIIRCDLEQNDNYYQAISDLAVSNLPNSYFLRQFDRQFNDNFSNIVFWEGYAKVLVKRGISNIQDIKQRLMIWLQDPCWPGFNDIVQFIVENKNSFKIELLTALQLSFEQNEPEWLEYIYLTYEKCYGATKEQKKKVYEAKEALENDIGDGEKVLWTLKLSKAFPLV